MKTIFLLQTGLSSIFILPIILAFIFIVIIVFSKKTDPVSDEDLEELIKNVNKKEEDLRKMNFIISEVDRISKEKTKAIRSSDWHMLKKLHEEEDRNRITFEYLSNKN